MVDKTNITLHIETDVNADSFAKIRKLITANVAAPLVKSLENMGSNLLKFVGETRVISNLKKQEDSKDKEKALSDAGDRKHKAILGAIGGVASLVGGILGIALSLKPVTTVLEAIGSMFKLIFLPIGMIMLAFLMPVLQGLAMVLNSKTFQGILLATTNFLKFVTGLNIPKLFVEAVNSLWKKLGVAFSSVVKILSTVDNDIINFWKAVRADLLHALIYLGENFIVKPLTALYNLLGLVKNSIIDAGKFIISHIEIFFNDILSGLKFIANIFTSGLRDAANFIIRPFVAMWDGIQKVFVPPLNVIKTILNYIFVGIRDVINAIRGVTNIGGDIKSIPSKIGGAVTGFFSGLAHLASGGSIISSGLAVVHKGENVIPAGASLNNGNGTTNITLHMTVNGVTDVRDLVDKVQKEIEKRTGRMLRWST